MTRFRSYALIAAAALGGGAWYVGGYPGSTEPAPLDVMRGAAEALEEEAETMGPVGASLSSGLGPRQEWDLPRAHNERVEFWIDFLSGRNRDRTQLWMEREGRYGPMIRERLHARGMPQDLIYLGMIESGLSPKAYSHAHAAGMWQFISETGRRYGLEVSSYVDERRDPVKATEAALDYLEDLYDRFGSWYLAAAGYNSGENRVERILRQRAGGQKGDDNLFWVIDQHLPRETRDYVPLMLAAAYIGKNPGQYGFHEVVLQAPLRYEETVVPGGVSLTAIAEAAGADRDEVELLNAHLLRGMTPPGREYPVRVPEGKARVLAASLERLTEDEREQRLASVVHSVRRGETLGHIARRYRVRVDDIQLANGGLDPRRLQVGQRLEVPVTGAVRAEPASWSTYRVRRGDSLWTIARQHGVSVGQLRSWNGVGNRIYPGQQLRLAV